jgi:putative transposase
MAITRPPNEDDNDPTIVHHRPDSAASPHAIFFTVDTVWLRRLYVLAFISIGSRRLEYFALTSKPNRAWMLQQARNLLMELDDHDRQVRFLIHDRDAKFLRAFEALLESDGIKVIHTPVRAPNANAHMERWVGTVRRECLDHLLILGHRQLEYVLRVYVKHYGCKSSRWTGGGSFARVPCWARVTAS